MFPATDLVALRVGQEVASLYPSFSREVVAQGVGRSSQVFLEAVHFGRSQIFSQPQGMFLVTGPTGAGKTTTLYAALSTINSIEKNIITLEDPIEYELPLIRQTPVNPKQA
jgi:type II secretory ATPase GspE/PulE/Tfp pilus assembly ATPase PilB-like protein